MGELKQGEAIEDVACTLLMKVSDKVPEGTNNVVATEEGPDLSIDEIFITIAPVVPDASNVKSSPSHITSLVAPLTKLSGVKQQRLRLP